MIRVKEAWTSLCAASMPRPLVSAPKSATATSQSARCVANSHICMLEQRTSSCVLCTLASPVHFALAMRQPAWDASPLYLPVFCLQLYEMALKYEPDTAIVSSGALAAISYEKTGA